MATRPSQVFKRKSPAAVGRMNEAVARLGLGPTQPLAPAQAPAPETAPPEAALPAPGAPAAPAQPARRPGRARAAPAADGYEVAMVPLADLVENPVNSRFLYSPASLNALAHSLATEGQRVSALGFRLPNGRVQLVDGHRRLRAARQAGLTHLRVELGAPIEDASALYLASRSANVARDAQTPLDDALAWSALIERGVFEDQRALARTLNLSETEVSRTVALAGLDPDLLLTLVGHPECLNLRMLTAIRQFTARATQDEWLPLVAEIVQRGMSSRDVENRVRALERGPARKERSTRVLLRFAPGTTAELRWFEGRGRLDVNLTAVKDPATGALLAERIRTVMLDVLGEPQPDALGAVPPVAAAPQPGPVKNEPRAARTAGGRKSSGKPGAPSVPARTKARARPVASNPHR